MPSPAFQPSDTPTATKTRRPTITPSEIEVATSTFDASSVITRTPPQPAQCPIEQLGLKPDFSLMDEKGMISWEQILDALNAGVTRKTIIEIYEQPYLWLGDTSIQEHDVTGDGIAELLLTLMSESFVAYVCNDEQYQAVWLPVYSYHYLQPAIIAIEDMNQDGVDEIIAGAGDDRVRHFTVYEWDGEQFQVLNNFDGFCMTLYGSSTVDVVDTNGNGIQELVLNQEIPIWSEYIMGLPWRKETRTCSWNGESYILTNTEYAPPEYRFQAVQDGDRASLEGDHEKALDYYQQAIFDDDLEWWSTERRQHELNLYSQEFVIKPTPDSSLSPDPAEFPNLVAYAYYRVMLVQIAQGNLPDAQFAYETLNESFPDNQVGHIYSELAGVFWKEFQSSSSLEQACAEAIGFASLHSVEVLSYLGNGDYANTNYGEQSMEYQPEDICPFQ